MCGAKRSTCSVSGLGVHVLTCVAKACGPSSAQNQGQLGRLGYSGQVAASFRPFWLKLIPIREEDWCFQAFSLDDPDVVYTHTVGASGFASAAFHWQRVAAALVRLGHYLSSFVAAVYHLLYADDGLLLPAGKDFWCRALFCLFVLELLEVPWKKVAGGTSLRWIGYQLDVFRFEKGIGPSKVQWLGRWIAECLDAGQVQGHQFKAVLGRLGFIAGALPHVRPFLGPLFAWSSQIHTGVVQLPLGISIILGFIKSEVERSPMTPPEFLAMQVGEVFRVDAKAQGTRLWWAAGKALVASVLGKHVGSPSRWIVGQPPGPMPKASHSGPSLPWS